MVLKSGFVIEKTSLPAQLSSWFGLIHTLGSLQHGLNTYVNVFSFFWLLCHIAQAVSKKTREVQVFSRSCWHASEFQIKCFFREVWEAWLLPSLVSQRSVKDSFKGPWFSGSAFSTKIFYASYLSNLKQLINTIYIWKFKSGVDFLCLFFISSLYRRWSAFTLCLNLAWIFRLTSLRMCFFTYIERFCLSCHLQYQAFFTMLLGENSVS